MCLGMLRRQFDRARILLERFASTPLLVQKQSQIVMRSEEAGLRSNCIAEVRFGGFDVAAGEQDRAEIDVRLGVIRVYRDGAAIPLDRLIEPAEMLEVEGDVVVRLRLVWLDGDGLLLLLDCAGVVAVGHAEEREAVV